MTSYDELMGEFEKRFNDIDWKYKHASAYGSFCSIIYGAWSLAKQKDCTLVTEWIEQSLANSIKVVERMAAERKEGDE